MSNKYGAKKCYWDVSNQRLITDKTPVEEAKSIWGKGFKTHFIPFDSLHEASVYQLLLARYPHAYVRPQYSIEIIPPSVCYPKGKKWCCDFAVFRDLSSKKVIRLVEAKGMMLRSFNYTLSLLEQNQPELFEVLDIVFPYDLKGSTLIHNVNKADTGAKAFTLKQYTKLLNMETETLNGRVHNRSN